MPFPPPSGPRGPRKQVRAGLSLVETCALISLGGVLTAVFVPTFFKHLRYSKVSEATEQLDALYRATAAYYGAERRIQNKLVRGCLPESAGPTPEAPSPTRVSVDFASDASVGFATWQTLGLGESSPRYSYRVTVADPGCGPRAAPVYPAVLFEAHGDLDGDGVQSLLSRSASISADQSALTPNLPLRITQRTE